MVEEGVDTIGKEGGVEGYEHIASGWASNTSGDFD